KLIGAQLHRRDEGGASRRVALDGRGEAGVPVEQSVDAQRLPRLEQLREAQLFPGRHSRDEAADQAIDTRERALVAAPRGALRLREHPGDESSAEAVAIGATPASRGDRG